MSRDPQVAIADILAAIAGIHEAIGAADFAAYQQSRPLRSPVEREIGTALQRIAAHLDPGP